MLNSIASKATHVDFPVSNPKPEVVHVIDKSLSKAIQTIEMSAHISILAASMGLIGGLGIGFYGLIKGSILSLIAGTTLTVTMSSSIVRLKQSMDQSVAKTTTYAVNKLLENSFSKTKRIS